MKTKTGIVKSSTQTILVPGGCGYIGTHTIVTLLESGYNVVVVDSLVNSSSVALDRVAEIVGLTPEARDERLVFYEVDICDKAKLRKVFEASPTFHSCINFASLKAVGESTRIPLKYYYNNLTGLLHLLELLDEFGCHSFVFSSSCTVYGDPEKVPVSEETSVGSRITNAYGRTKFMIEELLKDFYNSKKYSTSTNGMDWTIVILRYFNPIGAHPSGMIGEDPRGIPNNLMPYVTQVAVGRLEKLTIFGNDYDTPDGTCVRDYIHVMDLAEGHVCAVQYAAKSPSNTYIFNLGTGVGYSVLQVVAAMSKACGIEIPYVFGARRPGDVSCCYAEVSLARSEMQWEARRSMEVMCRDLWAWQSQNPQGFQK